MSITIYFEKDGKVSHVSHEGWGSKRVSIKEGQDLNLTGLVCPSVQFEPPLRRVPGFDGSAHRISRSEIGGINNGQFCIDIEGKKIFGISKVTHLKEPDNSLMP